MRWLLFFLALSSPVFRSIALADEADDPKVQADVYRKIAEDKLGSKDYWGAHTAILKATQLDPVSAKGWLLLGGIDHIYLKDNRDEALAAFKKYLELDPAAENKDKVKRYIAELKILKTESPGSAGEKLDDFEGGGSRFGVWWSGCDTFGSSFLSQKQFAPIAGGSPKTPGHCAQLAGHIGKNGNNQYAWVDLGLVRKTEEKPLDLTRYKAIRFYALGDGKKYRVKLSIPSVTDYAYYEASFTAPAQWSVVTLPFSGFAQPSWGKPVEKLFSGVEQILFTTDFLDSDFDVKIDDLELVN